MSAERKIDPRVWWEYEITEPELLTGPVPFPSARNSREVERAARALIAGRSKSIDNWLQKRATELSRMYVPREAAERDVFDLKDAIEARIVKIKMTEGRHED